MPKDLTLSRKSNPIVILLLLLASIASLLWYATFLHPENIGHPFAYAMLVFAEAVGMILMLGSWLTILSSPVDPSPAPDSLWQRFLRAFLRGEPSPLTDPRSRAVLKRLRDKELIAAFVTVAGEPLDVIARTVAAARDMRLPHRTVVLDDGASDEVRDLADRLGVEYLRRPTRDGKKAGNLNYGLSKVRTDFFAIFDADQEPHPDFLYETLPFLLADQKLAFLQTPQFFRNLDTFASVGAAESQEIFYKHIKSRKNLTNSAFCVGTNVLFRRKAIDDVGGIYAESKSEDIWTSLHLHRQGWKSLYIAKILAIGLTPDTIDSYLRQQFRWARGAFEIFFRHPPLFDRKLRLAQRLHYTHTGVHFFSGVATLFFYLLPLLYVYFGWKPIHAPLSEYVIHFLPYYMMLFLSHAYFLGRFPRWENFVLAATVFTAHLKALGSVLFASADAPWTPSGNKSRKHDVYAAIAPHLLLLLLSAGAIPVILLRPFEQSFSYMIVIWLAWNVATLFDVCRAALAPAKPAKYEDEPARSILLPSS